MNRARAIGIIASWLAAAVAAAEAQSLPNARQLREAVRGEVRAMPSLIRYHTFTDLEAEGLTFEPGKGAGAFETVTGQWPEDKAVRMDRGWLRADSVLDIPDSGFAVTAWFRHHGMGGLTHHRGRAVYSNGGIVASGGGWREGWRLVVSPAAGSVMFSIGRPEVGSVSITGRDCIQRERWHHVAATWDRATVKLYVDGYLRAETAYDGVYTPGVARAPFRIGEAGFGTGTVKLDVAEAAVFSKALSAEAVARFADPAAVLVDTFAGCLLAGDRASSASAARAEYARILAADVSGKPFVLGNYQAIARLRIAESLRRERRFDDARREYEQLAEDDAVPLHYRAQAMRGRGDAFRDERRYKDAYAAYRQMEDFFTGRHENWRVEARHRLADVEGLTDGEPFVAARQRRIDRVSRPAHEFFIAPDGAGSNPGTKRRPFATPGRARPAGRGGEEGGPPPRGGVG
nr:hypothetical protein [PVC group bacterium]